MILGFPFSKYPGFVVRVWKAPPRINNGGAFFLRFCSCLPRRQQIKQKAKNNQTTQTNRTNTLKTMPDPIKRNSERKEEETATKRKAPPKIDPHPINQLGSKIVEPKASRFFYAQPMNQRYFFFFKEHPKINPHQIHRLGLSSPRSLARQLQLEARASRQTSREAPRGAGGSAEDPGPVRANGWLVFGGGGASKWGFVLKGFW